MRTACCAGEEGAAPCRARLWICRICRDLWTNVQNALMSCMLAMARCVSHIRPQLPWKTGFPLHTPPVSHSSLEILAPGPPPTRITTAPQPRRRRSLIVSMTERRCQRNPKLNTSTHEGVSSSLRSDRCSDSSGTVVQLSPEPLFRFVGLRTSRLARAIGTRYLPAAWAPTFPLRTCS